MNMMKWVSKTVVNVQVNKVSDLEANVQELLKDVLEFWNLDSFKTSGIKQNKRKQFLEESLMQLGVGEWFGFGHTTDLRF